MGRLPNVLASRWETVVHSREAWGVEWTYLIKCVLLRQIVTVTMCIIDKATAKHNTTTNRSMIHGTCSGHQLEQGPPSAQRTWEPWEWVRWCWLIVHKYTYITSMYIHLLTFQYIYVCVFIFVYVCVYLGVQTYIYIYTYVHLFAYLFVFVSIVRLFLYKCIVHVCLFRGISLYSVYVQIYKYMYVHWLWLFLYICVYSNTKMLTYI